MKVDAADLVDSGDQVKDAPSSQALSHPQHPSQRLVFLISKENQQARGADPATLREARRLLKKLTRELQDTPKTVLAQVHGLKNPGLVRLL